MAPTVGLKPTAPQKLDGRRIEPTTCVPSAAVTMPVATAAAEPLLDPPGVRRGSCGFRVPRGWFAAPALEQRRAHLGGHVVGLDDVLDADRHAVNRRKGLTGAPALGGGVGGL